MFNETIVTTQIGSTVLLPPRPFIIFNHVFDANRVITIVPDENPRDWKQSCIRVYDGKEHIIYFANLNMNINDAIKEAFNSWKEALK